MGDAYFVSEEEKSEWECIGHELNKLAAMWAGGAVVLGASGVGLGAAVAAGLASAGFWYLSDVAADVADDPPQHAYRKSVVIAPLRVRRITGAGRLANKAAAPALKALKAGPIVRGLLDAAERTQGALSANSKQYVRTQSRRALSLHHQSVRHVATVSQSLITMSAAIQGTDLDVKVTHEHLKQLQRTVRKQGLPEDLAEALARAGFGSRDRKRYKQWLEKLYIRKLWTTRLSYASKVAGNILSRNASALER